jgi:hypothetical protein
MTPSRRVALAGGVIYLLTFAASMPQLALYAAPIDDPVGYIGGTGGVTAVRIGSWLEIVTALACIGTAIALYPITRRVSRTAAIGFVSSRILEAGVIMAGVMSMLAVLTLRADFAGASGEEATALGVTGAGLVAMRQWTFLIGPGFMAGINGLFLGYAMYRSRLVPRAIPALGLIGAPIILLSSSVTVLGGWSQVSAMGSLCAVPIAVWEFSLGVWLTVKGFRRTDVTDALDAEATRLPSDPRTRVVAA